MGVPWGQWLDSALDVNTCRNAYFSHDLAIGNGGGYVRLGIETHQWFEMAYGAPDADLFGGGLAFGFRF